MGGQRKSPRPAPGALQSMAERTGLEPATSGVTGQHSNQLNYRSALCCCAPPTSRRARHCKAMAGWNWRSGRDSNPRPPA
ncbi:hypothetical protein STPYR_10085 [uncultured Stenotrophomonas sp.]|uniref:Uncharacterized protein n=1 Tax=uncultured Stenotrophomonas sp. TaxID=165438 RepID=A0A1Y5Q2W8_9GAMM|nr:hypothetical protein STPYR_10085 [uncultured Stenotrophomonas sp.]